MNLEADVAGLLKHAQEGAPVDSLLASAEKLRLDERPGASFDASAVREQSWRTRLQVRARLDAFGDGEIVLVRRLFSTLRALEDALGERERGLPDLDADQEKFEREAARPILDSAPFYDCRLAPGFSVGTMPFRSGDVMLARGPTFLSASVARLGTPPGHYSHLVLLHVGPGGQVCTLESYHHLGLKTYELDVALRNCNLRLMLLRPRDAALGAASAEALFEVVRRAKRPIPYDFAQNFDEHSAVSCAEVASWAYELGSGGAVRLPMHPSRVTLEPGFRRQLGLEAERTFEPQDLEVDPRFELLLEWRDLRFTRDARHRDAIASALFDWSTRLGYRFRGSARTWAAMNVIWPLRHTPLWPLLLKLGAPPLSPSMPRSLLGTMQQIDEAGHLLLSRLREADRAHVEKTGRPMSPLELQQALEALRPSVHAIFRP